MHVCIHIWRQDTDLQIAITEVLVRNGKIKSWLILLDWRGKFSSTDSNEHKDDPGCIYWKTCHGSSDGTEGKMSKTNWKMVVMKEGWCNREVIPRVHVAVMGWYWDEETRGNHLEKNKLRRSWHCHFNRPTCRLYSPRQHLFENIHHLWHCVISHVDQKNVPASCVMLFIVSVTPFYLTSLLMNPNDEQTAIKQTDCARRLFTTNALDRPHYIAASKG